MTFAGLTLKSPVIAEITGAMPSGQFLRELAVAGAGAILLPPIDSTWLQQVHDSDELTDNHDTDSARRVSRRLISKLNTEEYMNAVRELQERTEVPLIPAIQDVGRRTWLDLAARCRDAGAAAIVVRPVLHHQVRGHRSDQIERETIRVTGSIASRLDFPVIPRIIAAPYGLQPLIQALGEAGARAVVVDPPEYPSREDINTIAVRESAQREVVTGTVALLYRRVSPHLAATLPGYEEGSLAAAVRAGATLGIARPADGDASAIAGLLKNLGRSMDREGNRTLFDLRGKGSESRKTSSLERHDDV